MATIVLRNIQFKPTDDPDAEWKTLCPTADVELSSNNKFDPSPFSEVIMSGTTITFKLRAKKKGTELEKAFYYKNHRKKRIRKKYLKKYLKVLGII